jgi:hypothetical protein
MAQLNIIVAASSNNVIGIENRSQRCIFIKGLIFQNFSNKFSYGFAQAR